MQIFYIPEIQGNEVALNESESKHAIRVLRLTRDDEVRLVDGKGGFFTALVADANPRKCKLSITSVERNYGKKDYKLHIAIAPTKNIDRFEWFLEKCTELGIDTITPILTSRSERKIIKPERLEKILISAMKQSVRAYLPRLESKIPFGEFISGAGAEDKYIAHCINENKMHLKNIVKPGRNVILLIGPEGDFSPEEVNLAKANGYFEVTLGDSRLRTETAGIAACHIVNLVNE